MHGPDLHGQPARLRGRDAPPSSSSTARGRSTSPGVGRLLAEHLGPGSGLPQVVDVRTLGAVGVVQLDVIRSTSPGSTRAAAASAASGCARSGPRLHDASLRLHRRGRAAHRRGDRRRGGGRARMSGWDAWLAERSDLRAARGVERFDAVLRLGGPRHGPRDALDLASNDYLGLSRDERVVGAAHEALDRYGASATASRLVTGTLPVHRDLEAALCRLAGQPSALAFSTGYAANLGVLTAFSGRGAEILLDAHAHASLHDAARMSRVPYATFAHNDPAALDAELAAPARPEGRRRRRVDLLRPRRCRAPARPRRGVPPPWRPARRRRGPRHRGGRARARPRPRARPRRRPRPRRHGDAVEGPRLAGRRRARVDRRARPPRQHRAELHLRHGARAGLGRCRVHGRGHRARATRRSRQRCVPTRAPSRRPAGSSRRPARCSRCRCRRPTARSPRRSTCAPQGVLVGCFRPPSVPDGVSRLRVTARADLDGEDLFQAARIVARTAALHGAPSRPDTVEGPRAGDAPSPARGLPSVAAVEGPQGPVPSVAPRRRLTPWRR